MQSLFINSMETQMNYLKTRVDVLESSKKNLFYLKIINEIDQWKFLSNEFENFELTFHDKLVCFGKGDIVNCLRKEEDNREFIKCQSEDCSVYGKIFTSKCDLIVCIGYKPHLIFEN